MLADIQFVLADLFRELGMAEPVADRAVSPILHR